MTLPAARPRTGLSPASANRIVQATLFLIRLGNARPTGALSGGCVSGPGPRDRGPASVHDADVRQMTASLCVVNAVAGDERVPNTNADEINRHINLPPLWLVEQRAHPELADLALAPQGDGKSDRPTSINYVIAPSQPRSGSRPCFLGGGRAAHANRGHLAAGPCKRSRVAPRSDSVAGTLNRRVPARFLFIGLPCDDPPRSSPARIRKKPT